MKPQYHLTSGTILSLILYLFFNVSLLNTCLFYIGTWLIPDLDHFITFFKKTKSINPKKFLENSFRNRSKWINLEKKEKEKYQYKPMFLHSIEFIVILICLSFLLNNLTYLVWGIIFHDILDVIDFIRRKENVFVKLSCFYTIFYNKKRNKYKCRDEI